MRASHSVNKYLRGLVSGPACSRGQGSGWAARNSVCIEVPGSEGDAHLGGVASGAGLSGGCPRRSASPARSDLAVSQAGVRCSGATSKLFVLQTYMLIPVFKCYRRARKYQARFLEEGGTHLLT